MLLQILDYAYVSVFALFHIAHLDRFRGRVGGRWQDALTNMISLKVQKDDSCIRDGDGEGNIEDLKKGKVPDECLGIIVGTFCKEDVILQGGWG